MRHRTVAAPWVRDDTLVPLVITRTVVLDRQTDTHTHTHTLTRIVTELLRMMDFTTLRREADRATPKKNDRYASSRDRGKHAHAVSVGCGQRNLCVSGVGLWPRFGTPLRSLSASWEIRIVPRYGWYSPVSYTHLTLPTILLV